MSEKRLCAPPYSFCAFGEYVKGILTYSKSTSNVFYSPRRIRLKKINLDGEYAKEYFPEHGEYVDQHKLKTNSTKFRPNKKF
jgi:hypothetical protein